ncbi:MAG TPA: hypothetical protein GXX28_12560 [Firmicutes bacterium]|nr:hypothetical protein [Bacillota bacterium]
MDELAIQHDPIVSSMVTDAGFCEQAATDMAVCDEESLASATNILGRVSTLRKGLEERRKFFVAPLNDQVKRINDLFRALAAPLDRVDQILRDKVLAYRREQERRRREEEERLRKLQEAEQKKLERKAEKKGLEPPPPPAPVVVAGPARTVSADLGKATIRVVWDFEIVDQSQLPREYLIPDITKIRAAVKAGVREIPGVRIYQNERLAVSGR